MYVPVLIRHDVRLRARLMADCQNQPTASASPCGSQQLTASSADSDVTPTTHELPATNHDPGTRSPVASWLQQFVQNMRMVVP
ncbi:MAG: hypothetical protein KDA99_16980 [Planctomycetales bacterium]|nr:hypothetical protein [Planctomycetales bacterium]